MEEEKAPRHEVIESMKRRSNWHDYHQRSIYMITPEQPVVTPTAIGDAVTEAWRTISAHYPEVHTMDIQLMPDHMHGILFVTTETSFHLGRVVNGLKIGCNKAYRSLGLASDAYPGLWAPRYHDRILYGEGQLERMRAYIKDNPRRLLMRRLNPELFKARQRVEAAGMDLDAQGNIFLLQAPWIEQVQVSRSVKTEEALQATVERYMSKARQGAVLVSPAISPGEKRTMRAAVDAGFPVIVVKEQGFSNYAKPGGRFFDTCAAGKLLLVSPWRYSTRHDDLTRERCHAMNAVAATVAATLATASTDTPAPQ